MPPVHPPPPNSLLVYQLPHLQLGSPWQMGRNPCSSLREGMEVCSDRIVLLLMLLVSPVRLGWSTHLRVSPEAQRRQACKGCKEWDKACLFLPNRNLKQASEPTRLMPPSLNRSHPMLGPALQAKLINRNFSLPNLHISPLNSAKDTPSKMSPAIPANSSHSKFHHSLVRLAYKERQRLRLGGESWMRERPQRCWLGDFKAGCMPQCLMRTWSKMKPYFRVKRDTTGLGKYPRLRCEI